MLFTQHSHSVHHRQLEKLEPCLYKLKWPPERCVCVCVCVESESCVCKAVIDERQLIRGPGVGAVKQCTDTEWLGLSYLCLCVCVFVCVFLARLLYTRLSVRRQMPHWA